MQLEHAFLGVSTKLVNEKPGLAENMLAIPRIRSNVYSMLAVAARN